VIEPVPDTEIDPPDVAVDCVIEVGVAVVTVTFSDGSVVNEI
jgi:hypothetical protein